MKTVTYEEFLKFEPCWLDNDKKMSQLKVYFEAIPNMSVLDMLALDDVSVKDRFWAVLREELIPANTLHEFACLCAEHALSKMEKPDPRCVDAITAKRKWMKGEITDIELKTAREAAWGAASDAASDAAWDAAWVARRAASAAARGAAWLATRAARVAAMDAEQEWQLDTLTKLLQEEQTNENDNI